ncbi:MAG: hypothetical protein UV38_C0001G0268 [candidate division TM6 bacterium GW2011_GWE2_42_60]|nr:MAG: hypothetical protein UV38_C0001G0268 [candidate division TM6 bacterium GW2011_GWE2_42_60]HBY05539.1 hypothetical protein [Candidatus Dependentiae bacterium]
MDATPYGRFVALVLFDQALTQITKQRQSIEKQCEALEEKRTELMSRYEATALELKNEIKHRGELELSLGTLAQEKQRIEHKIDTTRNAKEYEALQQELESVVTRQNADDERLIIVWQRIEQFEGALKSAEHEMVDALKSVEKELEEKRALLSDLERLFSDKERLRPAQREGVLEQWLSMYESMRAALIPNPAVTLAGSSCSECGVIVPRTDVASVEKHQFVFCQQCHRILFDRHAVE